jgi:hypothetical protein
MPATFPQFLGEKPPPVTYQCFLTICRQACVLQHQLRVLLHTQLGLTKVTCPLHTQLLQRQGAQQFCAQSKVVYCGFGHALCCCLCSCCRCI